MSRIEESGGKNIVSSGSSFTYTQEPLIINFQEHEIKMQVNFLYTKDGRKDVDFAPSADMTFLNLNVYNPTVTGAISKPILIGTNRTTKQPYYLMLGFTPFDNTILCHYTLFTNK